MAPFTPTTPTPPRRDNALVTVPILWPSVATATTNENTDFGTEEENEGVCELTCF